MEWANGRMRFTSLRCAIILKIISTNQLISLFAVSRSMTFLTALDLGRRFANAQKFVYT
jgi:hypothetical protein